METIATLPVGLEHCLGHLRVFLSVAEKGSITKSSEAIFKASSAITRSVRELEKGLGLPLFERKPRGMMLNAFGQAVLRRAERVDALVQQAADDVFRTRVGSERSVLTNLLYGGRKLQLLVQIAETRHLSTAAGRLGLGQAGASMSLARIESGLGRPLFHRMVQGMVATDTTDKLITAAKRIFAELRHLESDMSAISGTLLGTVVMGALPLGRTYVIPSAIAATLAAHPRLRIRTVEGPYETLAAALRTGDIDMIFGAVRSQSEALGLRTEPLFEDRIGILARAEHPLAGREVIALDQVLDQMWILPRPDAPGRRLVDDSFHELGLEPPVASVETGDLAVIRHLLSCSDLLTAMSPRQMQQEIAAGLIRELPVILGRTVRHIGLTLRDGALLSPAAHAVMDNIRHFSTTLQSTEPQA
ncbi:MAG: LysR family transcriptional [Rhodospirillaceae bacterium]|nr:MAG: LysR family transcriptional [Rhodospirillaceae bacterium]TNC95340.1 MAG: LysR family transcriptional regulator [Stygiobacter sp.]